MGLFIKKKEKNKKKTRNNPNNLDILFSSEVKNTRTVILISEVMPLSQNSPLLSMFEPTSRQTSNLQVKNYQGKLWWQELAIASSCHHNFP